MQHTPQEDGYVLLPEWAPHAATWISWPHNRDTWPGHFELVPWAFERWVKAMARHEPVHVLAAREEVWQQAFAAVGNIPQVHLFDIPTNDACIRDYGPMFFVDPHASRTALVDWKFNSWGEKYPPFDLDNEVPRRIAEQLELPRYAGPLVLEGGAIDHDGQGTFLISTAAVIDERRNPGRSRESVEREIAQYCGATRIYWIQADMEGDDTDGHVDQLARFVNEETIVYAKENNSADGNYASLSTLPQQLQSVRIGNGSRPELVPLPMPEPIMLDGARLPASYLNFYFVNKGLVVPQFDQATDDEVLDILEQLLPGRQMIPLPAREIVLGLGGFHCLSQQQPSATATTSNSLKA